MLSRNTISVIAKIQGLFTDLYEMTAIPVISYDKRTLLFYRMKLRSITSQTDNLSVAFYFYFNILLSIIFFCESLWNIRRIKRKSWFGRNFNHEKLIISRTHFIRILRNQKCHTLARNRNHWFVLYGFNYKKRSVNWPFLFCKKVR